MRFERAFRIFHCLHSPPPQIATDSTRCEFAAVRCSKKSVGETACCSSRRCEVHIAKNFVCCCWIALTSRKPRIALKEATPTVQELNCEMPTRPPNKSCSDCMTGLITCTRHMGTCVNLVWTACKVCTRLKCGKCLGKTCCDASRADLVKMDEDKSRGPTDDTVSRTSPTPGLASAETTALQSRNPQVTTNARYRNQMRITVCDRYSKSNDRSGVRDSLSGEQITSASTTARSSRAKQPSSSSSTSHADVHCTSSFISTPGGGMPATDVQKPTPSLASL